MKRYRYIPFAGGLAGGEGSKLAGLKEVSQGWYVQYSETLPSVPQLARHLSSFANRSGGWVFVGVKGQQKGEMTADSFPGVPATTVEQALAALHRAASAHVTPELCFETRIIEGPISEIDLSADRAIIIVGVPEGPLPPYVHSGRVYTRAADHRGPVPELDRWQLDLLHNRARETQRRMAEFISLRPDPAERQTDGPVRSFIYLLSDPLLVNGPLKLSHDLFSQLMRSRTESNIPPAIFDNLFTTADGYVARSSKEGDPFCEGPAFRWWLNGNARLTIPIETSDANEFLPHSDPRRSDFVRMLRTQGLGQARIADFSGFLAVLAAGTEKYLQLREALGSSGAFWSKVRFLNAWRAAPFISLRQYIERIKFYGFPILQEDEFYVPPGWSTDDLIKLEPGEHDGLKAQSMLLAMRLAASVLRAVGIDFDSFLTEDPRGLIRDLAESMNFVVEGPPGER
jgi:hypothetical protein